MKINEIIEKLKEGKTLLYPTDTILGLGCDAMNPEAVQKINTLKDRPASKNLILLVDSDGMLQRFVDVPDVAWEIMDVSEKPVTLIYDNPRGLPPEIVAEDNTIAIRKTNHKPTQSIIQQLKGPLVSTSANTSGNPTPKTLKDVAQEIIKGVDMVHPDCENFVPEHTASSIIKITKEGYVTVIRE